MTAALELADPRLLTRNDLTVDDLVDLPEDLHYELIDGRLVLTPRALPIHQFIEVRIANALEERCPDDFVVNVEQAILLSRRNERCPDVMIIRAEGASRSPILPTDVPLLVEIISASSVVADRQDKLKHYGDLGIPHYWIFDPLGGRVTATVFRLGADGQYHQRLHTDELVTVEEPWPVTLDLPAWTRKRDFLRSVARPER